MRIGRFIPQTEVEGPGRRAAIWVQGCSIGCPGCCNPGLLTREGGTERDPADLAAAVADLDIEGITILGGEPLDQADEVAAFLDHLDLATTGPLGVRHPDAGGPFRHPRRAAFRQSLGVILFSGYTWETLDRIPGAARVVARCDLIVAGPYQEERHPDVRRWIGSINQTIHVLTPRYAELAANWPPASREIEIHLTDDEIIINGTPFAPGLFPLHS